MNKRSVFLWISLLGLLTTYAFQKDNLSQFISWVHTASTACLEPTDLQVKNRTTTTATLVWDGQGATSWEYIVQQEGSGIPPAIGVSTTVEENLVTKDIWGNVLVDDTVYEYYVRAICSTTTSSDWVGPFYFKTLCLPVSVGTTAYTTGFNSALDLTCWTIVDADKNENEDDRENKWKFNPYSTYEGSGCVYFNGNGKPNNDWLISPTFTLSSGIYELSYYYRTDKYDSTDFEILVSTNGVETSAFTTTVMPVTTVKSGVYTYKKHYIKNITGNVNIAWHVVTNGSTLLYLDQVQLKQVSCVSPDPNIEIANLQKDKVTFAWVDDTNSSWEYFTQEVGKGIPTTSGSRTNAKRIVVTTTNGTGGGALQPGTEYEFYVRGVCTGSSVSNWIGPILFKTPCVAQAIPFWEGFNTGSTTVSCWSTIDNNRNGK